MTDVQLRSGARLRVRRAGQGRSLVMLHGWAMSSSVFSEWLDVPPDGVEVVAVDLPGHGGSAPSAGQDLESWVDVVEELCIALKLTEPVLFGWSLGGMLAQRLVLRKSVNWSALILCASTARFTLGSGWDAGLPSLQLRAMQRDLGRAFVPTLEGFYKLMFAPGEVSAERYRQIARFATGADRLPAPDVAKDGLNILGEADLRSALEQIDLPTLVVHGREDKIIPFAAAEALTDSIRMAKLAEMGGAGHAPFLTFPQKTRAVVEGFIS